MKDLESARHSGTLTEELLSSIAISLKRIADVITAPPLQMPELTPEQTEEFKKEIDKGFGHLVRKG